VPRDTQASVSGLQANQAVYFSMLKPGDVILGI
jgi:glycine/serine hydroxymethyltransferase